MQRSVLFLATCLSEAPNTPLISTFYISIKDHHVPDALPNAPYFYELVEKQMLYIVKN
jgi:hypothetical protein